MWNRKFKSLQVKMAIFGILSVAIGALLFFVIQFCGNYFVERLYLSEDKMQYRIERLVNKYDKYVTSGNLSSDDYDEMISWCKKQNNVYLMMYDATGRLQFETDGTMFSLYENGESSATSDGSTTYLISFADGDFEISMIEFSEYKYYDGIQFLGFAGALIGMIVCILAFNQTIIHKITFLSKQVREVRNGNLEKNVTLRSNDEIGRLGEDVNEMRLSIINHYEEAKDAWEANKELLTSISHDIRTPLTSVIGFSEMMDEETDMELMRQYAKTCREKAYQLKKLTDQMFRYFFVYGNVDMEVRLEKYEAAMFLEQFLGEYAAVLSITGYQIDFINLEEDCYIKTDVALLRRVFDNIFSNIEKYADKKEKITIQVIKNGKKLFIIIENVIEESLDFSESTHIGVKICRKMMQNLGGSYEDREINNRKINGTARRIYQSKIIMNLCGEEK